MNQQNCQAHQGQRYGHPKVNRLVPEGEKLLLHGVS